jgi:hypothetical protein
MFCIAIGLDGFFEFGGSCGSLGGAPGSFAVRGRLGLAASLGAGLLAGVGSKPGQQGFLRGDFFAVVMAG